MERGVSLFSRGRGMTPGFAAGNGASRIAMALQRRPRPAPAASARAAEAEVEVRECPLPPPSGHFGAPPFRRFYEPRGIRVMTEAFDLACRLLPDTVRRNERLCRLLALRIMRGFDAGEQDPMRLAASAVLWMRL